MSKAKSNQAKKTPKKNKTVKAKSKTKTESSSQDNNPHEEPIYEVTLEKALELAQAHHGAGNYVLADRTYRDILRAVPGHFPTTHLLGVLLYQTGNPEEALEYMLQALNEQPENVNIINNIGAIYTDTEQYEKALEAYDKVLEINPGFLDSVNNKALTLTLMKQYEEAEKLCAYLLEKAPENIEALLNTGIVYSYLSKHDEACEIWEKAAELFPKEERVYTNWGNTLRDMGLYAKSEEKCRQAIKLRPNSHEALNNLGNALRDRGKIEEAEKYYREATNIRPDFYEAHNNLAIALSDQNRFEEAVIAARYAVCFNKKDYKSYCTLSNALREMGEFALARSAAQRAVYLSPDDAEPYIELAEVNLASDFLDDGEAALNEALKREPDSPRVYLKLSDVRDKIGNIDGALEAIDKAIEMSDNMPLLWLKKAHILQSDFKQEESLQAIDTAIELAPGWNMAKIVKAEMLITIGENKKAEKIVREVLKETQDIPGAFSTLTSLKKFKSESDPDFKGLKKLLKNEKQRGLQGAIQINFALSDAYEQMGKYNKAFKHLKTANDYRRQLIPYNANAAPETYESVKVIYNKPFIEKHSKKGHKSNIPVFICGMPRSGTTLTEQIISSHPDVFAAGELREMNVVKRKHLHDLSSHIPEMGQEYLDMIIPKDKTGKAKHITDKMPGNYMNIGMIATILPHAKIIHCRRNPIDTCLSCYKQNFAQGQYWSYNLEEMAAEYNRYLDIMAYWRDTIPEAFIDIDYEDTVGNFEQQARYLIDYIGLPWDDACLTPHKKKRAVLTASKAQVTKPVYKSSVEKWKRYEKHLKPLTDNINMALYEQSLSDRKIKY